MTKQRLIYPALFAALLSGCSLIPDYNRPQIDIPTGWSEASAGSPTAVARNWWKNFDSAELDSLMAEALKNNNDLNAAIARVEQSRALLRTSRSSLYPSVNAAGTIGRERINPGEGKTTNDGTGNASLNVGYELDLFGANSAQIAADESTLAGSQFSRDATALIVMGDVAKGYFNVLNLEERLLISDQNLESSRELLRIVQARFDAGATTQLDVSRQKSDLASSEASRALIEQNLKIARSALAVLLGKAPQSLTIEAKNLRTLPVPAISPTQPSSLLERRPDIRQAEAVLVSANADIGVARAAFFPSIDIGLGAGVAATPLGDPATTTLSMLSNIAAPIFSGGLLEGNLALSKARKMELVEDYRKTVLTSFKDVEDALAGVDAAQKREKSLKTAMDEGRRAYELSKQQYDVGTIDFQALLDARQAMLLAEDNYIQTKNDRLAAAVDLYKALGGGWSEKGSREDRVIPAIGAVPIAAKAKKTDAALPPQKIDQSLGADTLLEQRTLPPQTTPKPNSR